jgi:hypothetical protein
MFRVHILTCITPCINLLDRNGVEGEGLKKKFNAQSDEGTEGCCPQTPLINLVNHHLQGLQLQSTFLHSILIAASLSHWAPRSRRRAPKVNIGDPAFP